ncbi:MAG: prevent-host-death protein [Spirochaetes bacterium]|nr:prevent-host-death protein [Spirochaetota bacterium]
MQKLTVGEFKNRFSEVLAQVRRGETIYVQYGKKRKIVGVFSPYTTEKKPKRKLGILEGKAKITIERDFKMTEEEFLGL